ncbi:pilus assembly PilX family protein [Agarilytica rhodophyticola]|uniref:pilus assembly PilX family protein n=1 Tax=Agarilytica rhodophyticola TaxID=1737490 RepID=UPI000B342CBD|nr:PilX N-terminal domain-containing pilus assembly protein [Agarilytica rhodophyticola]
MHISPDSNYKYSLRNIELKKNQQNGAALIVALVMLAVMTIIGVANMNSASLEMKMIASTLDRNKAFSIADAGLRAAESWLANSANIKEKDLYVDTCDPNVNNCFTANCSEGRCFEGVYNENAIPNFRRFGCEVFPSTSTSQRTAFWRNPDVWNDTGRHATVNVGTDTVKYIVEFLCFVDKGDSSSGSGPIPFDATTPNNNNGDALFRITVFFDGDGGRAPVMLQSNYVFPLS